MIKKRIIITESQLKRILKEDNEYFFDEFKDDVHKFVEDLLDNPNTAKVGDRLTKKGVDRGKLINALVECGFLTRKQKVSEVEGENKKKKSVMLPVYTAHMENGTKKLGEVFEKKLGLGKLPNFFKESVMDEGTLFEIEMDDELEETVSAGGAPMADGAGQVITKGCGLGINKKDPTFGRDFTPEHTDDTIRREVYNTKPKKSKTNESIEEASDRSEYYKRRWAEKKANGTLPDRREYNKRRWEKQKEEGTVPDRSEYWKERAKKQKEERAKKQKPKRKINKSYRNYFEWPEYERDPMDLTNDNDYGEYYGDHRDD